MINLANITLSRQTKGRNLPNNENSVIIYFPSCHPNMSVNFFVPSNTKLDILKNVHTVEKSSKNKAAFVSIYFNYGDKIIL